MYDRMFQALNSIYQQIAKIIEQNDTIIQQNKEFLDQQLIQLPDNRKNPSISLAEYTATYGISAFSDYDEPLISTTNRIVFPNGWIASIVPNSGTTIHGKDGIRVEKYSDKKYSVAVCDYNGYFNWRILNDYGAINGHIYCDDTDEVIAACEIIRGLSSDHR